MEHLRSIALVGLALSGPSSALADEVTLIAPGGMRCAIDRMTPEFEKKTVPQCPRSRRDRLDDSIPLVPTSGHHRPLDAPDVVTQAIIDVLDALDGRRPVSA